MVIYYLLNCCMFYYLFFWNIKLQNFIKYFDFAFYIKLYSVGNVRYMLKFYSDFLFWKLGKLKSDCEEYFLIY